MERQEGKDNQGKGQSWPGLPLYWKHPDLVEKVQRRAWIQCRGEMLKQGAGRGNSESATGLVYCQRKSQGVNCRNQCQACGCNPSTWEADERGAGIQG